MKRVWVIAIAVVAGLFLGPLLWALIEATLDATRSGPDAADRTAIALQDVVRYAEPQQSDRTIFDPHIYDVRTVARDCKVPWESLKSIDFDDGAFKLPWSPGRGWSEFTSRSIFTDVDEQQSLDTAALKSQTSVFERAFLFRCIASSVARPVCLAHVRSMTGRNRSFDDPQEKKIYAISREMQHENACRFLRGLAAERGGQSGGVSTP